ncbi:Arc family DNA-binding protein [Burkholderia glumae]|uniref:Arc family DNA-binding protein n=1 Tax=Burkholderia glumae TaxID=337 RepID=UPI002037283F|nr:Arc family DNA-binding protein [Burkholderia glumae]MCM2546214.1 Arc family DNA-binding protein [Burkholderia glumae]
MARSDPQVNIRMPQAMKDRLEAMRARSNRSLNGEILARLEATLSTTGGRALVYGPEMTGLYRQVEKLVAEKKLLADHVKTLSELVAVQRALLKTAGLVHPEDEQDAPGAGIPPTGATALEHPESPTPNLKRITRTKKPSSK